jgi:hypothetical protein
MFQVRRVHLGKTDQLDELDRECGDLFSALATGSRTPYLKGGGERPWHDDKMMLKYRQE